jgi:ketosteroid isomerase-like protein
MRRDTSSLIVFCLWAATLFAQNSITPPAKLPPAKSDSDLIQQLEDDWLKAERTTDPKAIDRILADDFVNLAPSGLAPGKAQLRETWKTHAGQVPPYTVESSDMRIYILGDTAVAAYSKTYTAKESGNVAHEDTTHVFTKEQGLWKLRISRSSFHP